MMNSVAFRFQNKFKNEAKSAKAVPSDKNIHYLKKKLTYTVGTHNIAS